MFSKPSKVRNDLYANNEDDEEEDDDEGEDSEGQKVMVRCSVRILKRGTL